MKFRDAELIGVPTIVVVGKAWRTAPSRSGPADRERGTWPPTTSSTTWCARAVVSVDAVIFDWGGTLTRWHDVDFTRSPSRSRRRWSTSTTPSRCRRPGCAANQAVWGRSRDHQQSATVADLFDEAGLEHDPDLLTAY